MKDGFIIRKPTVIHSRSRARRSAEAKSKGRHSGYGAFSPRTGAGALSLSRHSQLGSRHHFPSRARSISGGRCSAGAPQLPSTYSTWWGGTPAPRPAQSISPTPPLPWTARCQLHVGPPSQPEARTPCLPPGLPCCKHDGARLLARSRHDLAAGHNQATQQVHHRESQHCRSASGRLRPRRACSLPAGCTHLMAASTRHERSEGAIVLAHAVRASWLAVPCELPPARQLSCAPARCS